MGGDGGGVIREGEGGSGRGEGGGNSGGGGEGAGGGGEGAGVSVAVTWEVTLGVCSTAMPREELAAAALDSAVERETTAACNAVALGREINESN